MTGEQIMLGLKWCYQVEGSCGDCPYRPDDIKKAKCHDRLGNDVIGLIERQKAEIERLKKWNKIKIEEMRQERQEYFENTKKYRAGIEEKYEKMFLEAEAQIRPTAIKEFAQELKDRTSVYSNAGNSAFIQGCIETVDWFDSKIDDLVKEMVGEEK